MTHGWLQGDTKKDLGKEPGTSPKLHPHVQLLQFEHPVLHHYQIAEFVEASKVAVHGELGQEVAARFLKQN